MRSFDSATAHSSDLSHNLHRARGSKTTEIAGSLSSNFLVAERRFASTASRGPGNIRISALFGRLGGAQDVDALLWAIAIAGSLLVGAAYAWFAGEDISWDWRNYHEYSAFALLHRRLDVDVAPGGFQTFLNPLAYVPAYLLRHMVGAPFWGPMLGAIHGLNLVAILWVSLVILGTEASSVGIAAAILIAAFSPMTLSEVGTSLADILTALPIIAGIGLTLSLGKRTVGSFIVAGFLMGAATGLKLTNTTFAIGTGVSLLFAPRPRIAIVSYVTGGAIGGLATGGAWAWALWTRFGNPIFPFYNSIFRSPEASLDPIVDTRFMPHGILDALAYPFYWLVGDPRSSDCAFRDPRFAVVVVLLILVMAISRLRGVTAFGPRDKQFLLLFFMSYALWLQEFSIQRYAIPLELLTAPLIVLLICRFAEVLPEAWSKAKRYNSALIAIVALAIAVWSQPGDWPRRPSSDPYRPTLSDALRKPATYFLLQKAAWLRGPLTAFGISRISAL